jgi:hypothetical protein
MQLHGQGQRRLGWLFIVDEETCYTGGLRCSVKLEIASLFLTLITRKSSNAIGSSMSPEPRLMGRGRSRDASESLRRTTGFACTDAHAP